MDENPYRSPRSGKAPFWKPLPLLFLQILGLMIAITIFCLILGPIIGYLAGSASR
jgi:hypothetical protein